MLKTVSTGGTTGQLSYQGTWNANTNTPTLVSGTGTKNNYYVVSVAGTTTLDGISTWSVGDWAIFNGTVWEKVLGGTTESFANIAVTTASGYMFANGTSNVTAQPNIPVANVTGAVPNTVYIIAGTGLTGGGALTGNVTISASGGTNGTVTQVQGNGSVNGITLTGNVTTSGNLTLGGTLSGITNSQLQNNSVTIGNATVALGSTIANVGNVTIANVTIQSGNATLTNVTAQNHIATANIYANVTAGAFSYGTLGYSDVGILASYANSSNNYVQIVLQNTSSGTNASSDFVVVNDTGSAYADFGVTSSQYTGTGSFYKPNAPYLYAGSADLYIGTITANAIHIVANNATTDAITVAVNNAVTIPSLSSSNVTITGGTINVTTANVNATTASTATYGTASLPLQPLGFMEVDLNGTVVKVPYYAV